MFECISYNDQNKDMFHCNILSYFNLLLRFNLVANADTQKTSFFCCYISSQCFLYDPISEHHVDNCVAVELCGAC